VVFVMIEETPVLEDGAYSDGYSGKHNFCHAKINVCLLNKDRPT
jgi:hypothetical protein